ncbi:MAG: nuclear transport factor 2 family protein, partial [Bacteroidota bacterium]|nr:nuclear transport factor 2 family protein [Bacteroidota bacterium]
MLLIVTCIQGYTQSAEDSVKSIINKLFQAMKNSDGAALKECFADSAILQTITASGRIRNESVNAFVQQIGTLPKHAADERIQ